MCGLLIGNLYLPNGNPWPGPKFDYKLEWMDRLHAHAQGLLDSGAAGAADRRLQRHPDRPGRLQARALGRRTRCSRREAKAKFARAGRAGLDRRHPRAPSRTSASTPSGLIGGTRSSATPASASTMRCSARASRRSSRPPASTAPRAAGKKPATTRRCGSSWKCDRVRTALGFAADLDEVTGRLDDVFAGSAEMLDLRHRRRPVEAFGGCA